ncbi:hypothetical protein K2X14_07830 [Acetobacter sp. TBRC 12305]|uniref:Uncharacterized protein n=1 Tax=Acetobacter garciniae TaxID=2817435 RepID=A0A939KRK5_9PROT|nr:hypothetical protein [Acetobacter garciniae]MBO1325286.1 hypothetical protein [Acetobacter garciniae]MBX0344742.1 hypothetical protein [Acetobacter garciniae]
MNQQFETSRAVLEQMIHAHAPSDRVAIAMLHHVRQMGDAMAQEQAITNNRLCAQHAARRSTLRRFILGEATCTS